MSDFINILKFIWKAFFRSFSLLTSEKVNALKIFIASSYIIFITTKTQQYTVPKKYLEVFKNNSTSSFPLLCSVCIFYLKTLFPFYFSQAIIIQTIISWSPICVQVVFNLIISSLFRRSSDNSKRPSRCLEKQKIIISQKNFVLIRINEIFIITLWMSSVQMVQRLSLDQYVNQSH